MSERPEIKIGDYAIIGGRFSLDFRRVTKLTAQFVYGVEKGWDREWRSERSNVLFYGPEDAANKLLERLRSSDALYSQETHAARERQQKRDERLIADAFAVLSSTEKRKP